MAAVGPLDVPGRVVGVQNARLGKAVFGRDVAGRLTSCVAGALRQEWVYREGFLAEHTRGELGGATAVTMLGYDESGRVSQVAHGGEVTEYSYDGAGQLVGALTRGGGQGAEAGLVAESAWVYDQGGRLLEEVVGQGVRKFSYDDAGELVSVSAPDGSVTRFLYDGLGRRTQLVRPDGTRSEYAWSAAGYLTATHEVDSSGVSAAGHQLWVDALGELAEVDGAAAWWDTASAFPGLVGLGQEQVLSLPGGVTGFGDQWATPGWRSVRGSGGQDPWAVIGAASVADPISGVGVSPAGAAAVLPAGVAFTASGGVSVADLEWMGARVYDPAARGFLSTDPLQPTLGAGWDGNPYSFAGNNPVGLSDPLGLKPLSDQDLKSFDDSSRSWLSKNWEYVAGGAMVLGGGLLMATGVGGPLGMALVGAGADVIIQKATTGSVNWGEVAVSGALGLVMGPVAGKVGGLLAKGGSKLLSTVGSKALPMMGRAGEAVQGLAGRGVSAVSGLASRGTTALTSAVSKVSTRAGGYMSELEWGQMGKAAATNAVGGAATNTGWYYMTTPLDQQSGWGAAGAAVGGAVGGAGLSQAGYLSNPLSGLSSKAIKYGMGAGSSMAGDSIAHGMAGDSIGMLDLGFDAISGVALTHFPGAAEISPDSTPGWGTHAGAAYAGAHGTLISNSIQFVGHQLL